MVALFIIFEVWTYKKKSVKTLNYTMVFDLLKWSKSIIQKNVIKL